MKTMKEIKRMVTEISVKSKDPEFEDWKAVEMKADEVPESFYRNPNDRVACPNAGYGQYPAVCIEKMMNAMKDVIPDENIRYKFIVEKRIFMYEESIEKARELEKIFDPDGNLDLNLFVGDILKAPKMFFLFRKDVRETIFPWHTVRGYDKVPIDKRPSVIIVLHQNKPLLIDLEKDVVNWPRYLLDAMGK